MAEAWPGAAEVNAAVAERVQALLNETGGLVAHIGQRVLCEDQRILAPNAASLTSLLVARTCLSAGRDWPAALWPAVSTELMMAAADLFDDVADLDPGSEALTSPGVVLTAGAGLLALAGSAAARVVDDGLDPATAAALCHLLGTEFARAANGQAANLQPEPAADALTVYQQSSAKSGPLGSMIARLGARTATDRADLLALYGDLGWSLAVRSQLLNDARDAAGGAKSDVRVGARTVPLAFTGSRGAPAQLSGEALAAWETRERERIAAGGGLVAARALAEAARLRAVQAVDALEQLGRPVAGLRDLVA